MSTLNGRFPGIDMTRIHERLIAAGMITREQIEWEKAELVRQEALAANGTAPAADELDAELPPLRSLMDISAGITDPRKTVLGNRFLCIGGGLLFVGPSGIGKSSASAQQDILWSIGKEAFGIRPQRPLRILTIQSENDDEDLAEMRDGVVKGLRLSDDEKEVVRRNVFYDTEQTRTGPAFLAYVERRLQSCPGLDLLRLDPFMGCLGADPTDTEKTMAFLRNGLNPLLTRYQVACILNHHTPKTTNRQTDSWRGSDWMYAAAGGADITNWARAVMVIDPTHVPHVFKFIAAKRGPRVGWVDEDFKKQIIRHFCHAEDGIYWRAATEDDLMAAQEAAAAKGGPANKKAVLTVEKLLKFIPENTTIEQGQLKARIEQAGYPVNPTRAVIKDALDEGVIHRHEFKRFKKSPEVHYGRHAQQKMVRPSASNESEK